MNRWIKFLAGAVPLLAAGFAFGEIANSAHDFSAAAWSDNQICKPCHTPHNGNTTITGRLWAHTLSTQTYTYHGTTAANGTDGITKLDSANGTAAQTDMDSATRLCLSCHDGTVALDSFMGKDGASDGKVMGADADHGSADANFGTDLSNDHPVGFKAMYKENSGSGSDYYYKPLAGVLTALGGKLAKSPTAVPGGALQQDGVTPIAYTNWYSVSCVSCHDVHNHGSDPDKPGLLRISNDGSALCLTCHNK